MNRKYTERTATLVSGLVDRLNEWDGTDKGLVPAVTALARLYSSPGDAIAGLHAVAAAIGAMYQRDPSTAREVYLQIAKDAFDGAVAGVAELEATPC